MRDLILGAAATLLIAAANPAHAQTPGAAHYGMDTVDYSNPYDDDAPKGLHFGNLEAAIPTDPLLWSSDPGWKPHHTPASMLSPALDTLNAAVPHGTPAEAAELTLRHAGAQCFLTSLNTELACRYRDIETPWSGEVTDDVTWMVRISLVNGHTDNIAVTRDWTRH